MRKNRDWAKRSLFLWPTNDSLRTSEIVSPLPIIVTPSDVQPNVNYTIYEDLRHDLLSQPRGRAALQYGGIIWRLAREEFSIDTWLLAGPSGSLRHAKVIDLPDGQWGVGDGLSEQEMELIIGMYKTPNRTSSDCTRIIKKIH